MGSSARDQKTGGAAPDSPPKFLHQPSSGDWSKRLGGNTALANQLDFLRDRSKEDLVKRTAEREAARKADMKKPDKHSSQAERDTWRLRDEREV